MKFTELKSSLNQIKPCYYICGKDAFLRQSSQKLIEKACAPNLPDFNILRFDDENFSKNAFFDGVRSFPMGDNFRVVVVKAKVIDKQAVDKIVEYLQTPSKTSCVVFVREEKIAIEKEILKFAEVVDCDYLDEPLVLRIIAKEIQGKGCSINVDAVKLLASYCSLNMSKINLEIEKLCAYVGKGGEISKADVELLVTKDIEYGVFELSNAVLEKNGKKANDILSYMLKNNESPQNMFGLLLSSFRRLFYARTSSLSNSELADALSVKEYAIKIARNQKVSPVKLKNILELGADLDLKIRKGEIIDENALFTFVASCLKI